MNVEFLEEFGDTVSRTVQRLCENFCKPEAQDTISSIIAFGGVCGTAWKCLSFLISSDLFGPDGDGNAKFQLRLALRSLPAEWLLDPSWSIRLYQSFG